MHWAYNTFNRWEYTENKDTLDNYRNLIRWSESQQQYMPRAKYEFADTSSADAWLVAHTLAGQWVVVTEEVFDPNIRKRIPIPNVYKEFSVRCIDTFQMLRELKIRFT